MWYLWQISFLRPIKLCWSQSTDFPDKPSIMSAENLTNIFNEYFCQNYFFSQKIHPIKTSKNSKVSHVAFFNHTEFGHFSCFWTLVKFQYSRHFVSRHFWQVTLLIALRPEGYFWAVQWTSHGWIVFNAMQCIEYQHLGWPNAQQLSIILPRKEKWKWKPLKGRVLHLD